MGTAAREMFKSLPVSVKVMLLKCKPAQTPDTDILRTMVFIVR